MADTPGANDPVEQKLDALERLKDYAIGHRLPVTDEILDDIAQARHTESHRERQVLIDRSIRDLTALTYPTTIETISEQGTGLFGSSRAYFRLLMILGVLALIIVVIAASLSDVETLDPRYQELNRNLVPVFLGLLGTLIYIYFHLIGVLSEKAFSQDDTYTNSLRLIIGAIAGWVSYYAIVPDLGKDGAAWQLLVPFLAGFSIRLVVGIITQAISAVELTLGLENKDAQLRMRGRQSAFDPSGSGRHLSGAASSEVVAELLQTIGRQQEELAALRSGAETDASGETPEKRPDDDDKAVFPKPEA